MEVIETSVSGFRARFNAIVALILLIAVHSQATDRGNSTVLSPKCGLADRLEDMGLIERSAERRRFTGLRPETEASLQSSRVIGKFLIFYDTSGINAPALLMGDSVRIPNTAEAYVESVGRYMNEVFFYEIDSLGYQNPLVPSQAYYSVYLADIDYYGETVPDSLIGISTPARYRSHINLDNDYLGFYTPGIAGLKVTAAHEFFHAIQFGSYGFWAGDLYFAELSATWMEDVVYDSINDYYDYLRGPALPGVGYSPRGQFSQPDISFVVTNQLIEYSRAVFGKYLEKRFSGTIIRSVWESISHAPAIVSLDNVLSTQGSSFREAFLQWAQWNSMTGPLADTATFYEEGREYPPMRMKANVEYTPPSRVILDSIQTISSVYYPILVNGDPMVSIISNLRTSGGVERNAFTYELSATGDASYKQLSNGVFVRIVVPDPGNWATQESSPNIIPEVTLAPNPFVYDGLKSLRFQVPQTSKPEDVRLKVLSMGMQEIFSGPITVRGDLSTQFVQIAEWNAHDMFGQPVSSGIYYFVLDVDGQEHTGKFAVIRK